MSSHQKKVPHKEWVSKLSDVVNTTIMDVLTSLSENVELFEMSDNNVRVINRVVVEKVKAFSKKMYLFLEESGNPRKQRAPRSEDAPKRAETAYMCFCRLNRKTYKTNNPKLDNSDITRLLSSDWKKMSEKDKQKYVSEALQDKSRFEKEMVQYKEKETEKNVVVKKISRPHLIYYSEHRAEMKLAYPGLKFPQITQKLAEKWNLLSKEQKDAYKKQAELNKAENLSSNIISNNTSPNSSDDVEDDDEASNSEDELDENKEEDKKEEKVVEKKTEKKNEKEKKGDDKDVKKKVGKLISKLEKTKASTLKTMEKKINAIKDEIKELCDDEMYDSFSAKIEDMMAKKISMAKSIEAEKKANKQKKVSKEIPKEKKQSKDEDDEEDEEE